MELSKIKAMKVVELKTELETRGLAKSGTKAVLVDRLFKAIQDEEPTSQTEEVETTVDDGLDEWEENIEGLENIVDTVIGDLDDPEDDDTQETKSIEQEEAQESEEPPKEEMVDEPGQSGATETDPVDEETSAEDAPDKVESITTDLKSEDPKAEQTETVTEAVDAAEVVTEAPSAEGSLVSDVDPAAVQDNQNFDVDTKEANKDGTTDPDSSLLNDEAGGDELDYGDGDDTKEEMISFQIEESEIAIVETGTKETTEESVPAEAKAEEAPGDATKKEDKPSDEKEEEGHPDIMKMIWVSNLTKQTRALDLKTCFGLYGKVMSAKVVMNPNAKEAKCFGLVTMSQESEAETAIQKLNGYKLHNKEIVTSRPKKDNAVLRKMRQQQLKPSSRPAGIRPRHTSPEDKSKPRSDKERAGDRDRRVVSGSGTISVNIKSDDLKRRSSDRRRRTRSRSTTRKGPGPSTGGPSTSVRTSPARRPDRPRSPRRRRTRSPRRKSRSPRRKSRSPRRRSSPTRRKSRSPRRKSKSPVKPITERTVRRTSPKPRSPKRPSPPKRSPLHKRPSPRRSSPPRHSLGNRRSPRRSPRRPDRRRNSRSPKRARRSHSRERRRPKSRSTERKVTAGSPAKETELRMLREQTAKQEAAIKALMQGNVQNLGGMLGESLTEKLAADLKSALVKQLQNTVKTMSSKATNKAALIEAQNASNAAKIKENLEKMKANGQITNLITNQPRPAPPSLAPPPLQTFPKYSSTPSLPSFNPLMVSHKQPPTAPVQEYTSQRSSSRDSYSRSSHDRPRSTHGSSSHPSSSHPSSTHPSSSHVGPSHMSSSHGSSYGSSSHGTSHGSGHASSHTSHNPGHSSSHGHSSSSHSSSRDGHTSSSYNPSSSSSSSRPSRSDTYSSARSEARPSTGQQSNQINDLLKSLQGVKEMVNTKPSTYGNVPQPPQAPGPNTYQKVQQQVQTYKTNPMMQPPPMPFSQPPPGPAQQFGNVPAAINFTQPNGPPLQWAPPPFNAGAPPFLNNPNNQFRR